jgi:RNA polymerase sigma-70 factor, ECF subfamily
MTNQSEFEAFMAAYQDMVFTTASRLLASSVDAQDVAQEVFLKAYERFEQLRESPTAGGWLKTVTRNLCLNQLTRYRSRWRFFSEMFSTEDEMEVDFPAPDTFAEDLDRADNRELLETALEKLPAAQRIPLVLYHFEDQSYEEIAATLKVSLSKIKTDIFRGRENLRKRLTQHTDLPGNADDKPTQDRAQLRRDNSKFDRRQTTWGFPRQTLAPELL